MKNRKREETDVQMRYRFRVHLLSSMPFRSDNENEAGQRGRPLTIICHPNVSTDLDD